MRRKNGRFRVVAGGICAAIAANLASAATFTWDGGHTSSSDWTQSANWNGNIAPPSDNSADIHFGGVNRLTPNVNIAQSILSITFDNTAGQFSITGTENLTIGAGGISNRDNTVQTINAPLVLGAAQTWTSGVEFSSGNLVIGSALNTGAFQLTLNAL